MHLEEKSRQLYQILLSYGRVGIAFSGGVDSSLLLKLALDVLGAGNVWPLFARSDLLKPQELERALTWLPEHGYTCGIELEVVDLPIYTWKDVLSNTANRCYFCKRRIYTLFLERMEQQGFGVLLDGTNADDLKTKRPGLRAALGLEVKMPLVEAGFAKAEVRELANRLGMRNWDQPSASCLATRIPTNTLITSQRMAQILRWEDAVERMGFAGCRVRPMGKTADTAVLQIGEADFPRLGSSALRSALLRFFQGEGIRRIFLDMDGRETLG